MTVEFVSSGTGNAGCRGQENAGKAGVEQDCEGLRRGAEGQICVILSLSEGYVEVV